jgi:predicted PurR-regulated permease PerM
MSEISKTAHWQRSVVMLTHILLVVTVLCALYFMQDVFIPLALAIFFSFLLYPLVKILQRQGIPRNVAVIAVIVGTLLFLGIGGWVVSTQLRNLTRELPNYSRNITTKLTAVQSWASGSEQWKSFTQEMSGVIRGNPGKTATDAEVPSTEAAKDEKTAMVVKEETNNWMGIVASYSGHVLAFMGELALALVLAIFILIKREDLINRVLRLVGEHRVSMTSKAVSETGQRMSRFLLVQFLVNTTFGVLLTVCLLLLGVNYALLWGFLTAVLRYLPYIGPWVSAIFPVVMSLAQFDGWWQPVVVLGFYLMLEIIISNFVEPYLYGQSIGVSEVALLVSAAFWAWMWGLVGLILSAPLTVVLVVISKYFSELNYITILLSDEPALGKDMSLYQRLLAEDIDEAERMVATRLAEEHPEMIYDEMLMPTLYHLKGDYKRRTLDQEQVKEVEETVQAMIIDIADTKPIAKTEDVAIPVKRVPLLAFGVRDVSDRLVLEMLGQVLDERKWNYKVAPSNTLISEIMEKLSKEPVEALILSALQPINTAHLRHLCKKIRTEHQNVKIMIGLWGPDKLSDGKIAALKEFGADWAGNTLEEASIALAAWYPVWSEQPKRQVA